MTQENITFKKRIFRI